MPRVTFTAEMVMGPCQCGSCGRWDTKRSWVLVWPFRLKAAHCLACGMETLDESVVWTWLFRWFLIHFWTGATELER